MTSGTTLVLDGGPVSASLVGGKAHALNRLIGAGARVPATGVVTTAAYRRFVASGGLDRFLAEVRAGPFPDHADLEREASRVDDAFLHAPMARELRDEIRRLADSTRGGGLLAVRSSATAEDMAAASFAGQYRSFLEIDSDEDLLRSVRLVWGSLWLPAPRAYRARAGIDESDLAMAVVVMRLVEARRAGVAFTVDPAGDGSTLRVEAVDGLAESMVSGAVTPDAYVLARSSSRRASVDGVIDEVAEQALRVERWFGVPQDVEWAHDGGRLFIVQARPITVSARGWADGFDTPVRATDTYTTAGIAEMLPGVLPPLLWTTVRTPLEEGFRRLFDGLHALPAEADHAAFLARVRGRALVSLDLLKAAARSVPGASSDELERQYFGRVISGGSPESARPSGPLKGLRTMLAGVREINARRRFRVEAAIVVETIRLVSTAPPDCRRMDTMDVLGYLHRLLDVASRAFAAEVAVAAAAAAAYRGVELFLEPHLREGASRVAQDLTSGGIDPCGVELALDTCAIAAHALEHRELHAALTGMSAGSSVRSVLESSQAGRHLLESVERELARAGSASVFAGETWQESEELAWQLIVQAVRRELHEPREMVDPATRAARIEAVRARIASSWKYRLQRVMTGQVVDIRGRMLRRLVLDAVEFLRLRERTKSAILLLGGEVRRVHLEIGSRLVASGVLAAPRDVELLGAGEIEDAIGDRPPSLWELERRRAALQAMVDTPVPQVLTGRPDASTPPPSQDGDAFTGWAAASGTHEGPARVIVRPAESIAPGDVLVARTTDPSWTPLFLTAGAIVVEEGGPLSHAAIIARELGLPAVLNVPGIIERLARQPDARLRVDGDLGVVRIVQAADRAPPAPGDVTG